MEKLRIYAIWLFKYCSWSDDIQRWVRLFSAVKKQYTNNFSRSGDVIRSEHTESFPKVEMC